MAVAASYLEPKGPAPVGRSCEAEHLGGACIGQSNRKGLVRMPGAGLGVVRGHRAK